MTGPRVAAAEAEIDRDIAEWVGPQDVEAYRRAMRGTLWYRSAVLSDAMLAPFQAALVWARRNRG